MTTLNVLSYALKNVEMNQVKDKNQVSLEELTETVGTFQQILQKAETDYSYESNNESVSYADADTSNGLKESNDVNSSDALNHYRARVSDKIKSQNEAIEPVKVVVNEEALEEFSEEMIALLCNTLNITPEELSLKLEELDLQMNDLLEPSNLATLFTHFGDGVTVADSLVSEEFQTIMKRMDELGLNLLEKLGVTHEELKEYMESYHLFEGEEVNMPISNGSEDMDNRLQQEVPVEGKQVTEDNAKKTPVVEVVSEKQSAETVVEISNDELEAPVVATNEINSDASQQNAMDSKHSLGEESNSAEEMFTKLNPEETFAKESSNEGEVIRDNLGEQVVKQNTFIDSDGTVVKETVKVVDLQSLVSEITEYVRLTSGNEFSKIEMQLNPVNLGKMLIEVSTLNGEVTTKIIAQTEAGKEAVESNLAQLRTNLEQQGVKVAAVEVTVESHAFEQNLQGEQSNEQQQLLKEQQDAIKSQHLNLNVSEMTLDELSGILSEEELLTVKMMQESGNTMDLTV